MGNNQPLVLTLLDDDKELDALEPPEPSMLERAGHWLSQLSRNPTTLRHLILAAFAILNALALVSIVYAATGVSRENAAMVPGSGLSTSLIWMSICMCLGALVALVGFTKQRGYVFGGGLVVAGIFLLFYMILGVVAYSKSGFSYVVDATLEEQWQYAKAAQRADIEHLFGCCGFEGPGDFYGANWNATCGASLVKSTCCRGITQWDKLHASNYTTTDTCTATQERYQCCVSAATWPCYRLPPCHSALLAWYQSHYAALFRFVIGVGAVMVASFVSIVALSVAIDSVAESVDEFATM